MPDPLDGEFEAVFRSEYARVVGAVRWIADDIGVAEEIAQEAFCRALERWERVATHDRPGAWVQLTALRLGLRRRRRDQRRAVLLPAWSPPPTTLPVDVDLEAAIAGLPDGQRAALVLHHLLDMPVGDVAAVLGVRPGTVKTQLHRARLRLAAVLGEDEEVADGTR